MTPFQRAVVPQSEIDLVCADLREQFTANRDRCIADWGVDPGITLDALLTSVARLAREGEVWRNDVYQVQARQLEAVDPRVPPMVHLSIKRLDRGPVRDWRDLQQIKNEIVGPECEAVELYPAESRVVDTANQYHLWAFVTPYFRFPFGFSHGGRSTTPLGKSQQRAL